jgi:hypothetical protein
MQAASIRREAKHRRQTATLCARFMLECAGYARRSAAGVDGEKEHVWRGCYR